jgi:hypothetical protein
LSPCRPSYQGIDVESLVAQIDQCRVLTNPLADDEDLGFDESYLPRIHCR